MPNILCSTELSIDEGLKVRALSVVLEKTVEEVIRMAVSSFSSACVPTQADEKKPAV